MALLVENKVAIITGLFLLSEILALIPGIKSNSIFQLVSNFIKNLAEKK